MLINQSVIKAIDEVIECFNSASSQIMKDLFDNIEDFKFTFLPVWMSLEQRGHLFTSSPLNYIITWNKRLLKEGRKPKDIERTITLIKNRMNMYLQEAKLNDWDLITHKISYFTDLYGVIYLYFSDQTITDLLPETFKEDQTWNEEIFCLNSIDSELPLKIDENLISEVDSQQEIIDGVIGKIESVFREINGIPKLDWFSDQFISKIQLNSLSSLKFTHKIVDFQYIWIKYLSQNKRDLNSRNINSSTNEEFSYDFSNALWTMAKLEKIEGNTIWISGSTILHNSYITEILPMNHLKSLLLKNASIGPLNPKGWSIKTELPTCTKIVRYSEQVLKDLEEIANQGKLDFYSSRDSIIQALNIVLNMNPNCILTITKTLKREIRAIAYDNLTVIYEKDYASINVFKVIWSTYFIETGSEHTKEWLDSLSNVLNIETILPIKN